MKRFALCAAMIALAAPALGQTVEFQDVISGKNIPLSLTLKDLNSDWRRMNIGGAEGGKGLDLGSLMQMGMMSEMGKNQGGKPNDAAGAAMGMMFLSSLFGGGMGENEPVYYTKGQTLNVAGEVFLVAYRVEKKQPNFMELIAESAKNGGKEPDFSKMMPGKLTAESSLVLSLLNFKTVGSISDIRPFDLKKELEESNKAGGGLMDLFAQGAAKQGAAGEQGAEKPVSAEERELTVTAPVEIALMSDKTVGDSRNEIQVALKGNALYLRGHVVTSAMKQRATNLAQKALKDAGQSYTVKNELTVRSGKGR